MQNLNSLQDALKNNGQALAYQFLDGMNWKQHTYSDIKHSLDNTIAYLSTNGFENKKVFSCGSTTLENFLTLSPFPNSVFPSSPFLVYILLRTTILPLFFKINKDNN